jgi:hypothetical protein
MLASHLWNLSPELAPRLGLSPGFRKCLLLGLSSKKSNARVLLRSHVGTIVGRVLHQPARVPAQRRGALTVPERALNPRCNGHRPAAACTSAVASILVVPHTCSQRRSSAARRAHRVQTGFGKTTAMEETSVRQTTWCRLRGAKCRWVVNA